jgi:hypothetical protein
MLSMRGFIPVCIIIQSESALYSKKKIYGLSLLTLKWMKKRKIEMGDNQFLYRTTVKADNNFKCAFREIIVTIV